MVLEMAERLTLGSCIINDEFLLSVLDPEPSYCFTCKLQYRVFVVKIAYGERPGIYCSPSISRSNKMQPHHG
jgi:hypothetical protein